MSLRADATLEAFIDKITRDKEIMSIMGLPVINETDTSKDITKKRKVIIDKVITKTAQVPTDLTQPLPKIKLDDEVYDNYGKTRMTISFAQSINMNSDLFGNPQIDINIYYDNTNLNNVFKLVDLISDEFSGQNLKVKIEEKDSFFVRQIRCEGQTAQVNIINNFERIGLRFSFFAKLYKI